MCAPTAQMSPVLGVHRLPGSWISKDQALVLWFAQQRQADAFIRCCRAASGGHYYSVGQAAGKGAQWVRAPKSPRQRVKLVGLLAAAKPQAGVGRCCTFALTSTLAVSGNLGVQDWKGLCSLSWFETSGLSDSPSTQMIKRWGRGEDVPLGALPAPPRLQHLSMLRSSCTVSPSPPRSPHSDHGKQGSILRPEQGCPGQD